MRRGEQGVGRGMGGSQPGEGGSWVKAWLMEDVMSFSESQTFPNFILPQW
jgi:hypothetical protein